MFIYKVTNLINGKSYIGQTIKSLSYRWSQHCRNRRGCSALRDAIKKYGKENFTIEEIGGATNQTELNYQEWFLINKYNTLAPNGYNLKSGGGSKGKLTQQIKDTLCLTSGGKQFKAWEITTNGSASSHKTFIKKTKYLGEFLNQTTLAKKLNILQASMVDCLKQRQNRVKNYIFIYSDANYTIEDAVLACNSKYDKFKNRKLKNQKPFKIWKIINDNGKKGKQYKVNKVEYVGEFLNQNAVRQEKKIKVADCLGGRIKMSHNHIVLWSDGRDTIEGKIREINNG